MPNILCTFLNDSQSNAPLCNSMKCRVISWKTLQKHGNVKMMSQLFQQLSHWHSKGDWASPQTTIK